ncbi:hypothetical protein L3X38_029283 [Prunus dulcis]|uniref:Uncharacterized protein n=1 Tax=Prunus dulcis TaxID=3755 RepID=A0AAD4Z218_PRUDU|nr:hypothetical protein L3X38_029283 [Prunus dulcis]
MGTRPDRSNAARQGAGKICRGCRRLLHQMGRSRTSGNHNDSKNGGFRLDSYLLPIRPSPVKRSSRSNKQNCEEAIETAAGQGQGSLAGKASRSTVGHSDVLPIVHWRNSFFPGFRFGSGGACGNW